MGSCCTLIANRLQSAPSIPSLSECSLLLEGTILLDTLNLSTVSIKTTKEDFAAVEWLEQHREKAVTQQSLFDSLCNAKYDESFWSALSTQEILEYDYKACRTNAFKLGWSVALIPLKQVVGAAGFREELSGFAKKMGVDGMIISTVVLGNPPVREIAFFSTNERKTALFWNSVERFETEMQKRYACQMEEGEGHALKSTDPWSRKGVIPLLSSFF